jgi:predicted GH43/DUF377 family glycosyl hydrolase
VVAQDPMTRGPFAGKYEGFFAEDMSNPDSSPGSVQGEKGRGEIFMAVSDNGIDWKPVGKQPRGTPVLRPRAGEFDGRLVEPAGPPIRLPDGNLLLIVNGDAPPHGYRAGWVVLDGSDPRRVLRRSKGPFFDQRESFELDGPVPKVIFVSGATIIRPEQGKPQLLISYGFNDGGVATARAELDPYFARSL